MRTRFRSGLLSLLLAAVSGIATAAPTPKTQWVQDTFEDFSAGTLDSAGADLFVTRRGTIRTTHRFDLNNDGFIDLVFNSSHDERRALLPTSIEVSAGQREPRPLSLPTYGTSAAVIADLNRDGWPEVVLLPNDNGTTKRRQLSIFWADREGWSGERRTNLWTMAARALAVADLNGDGWPDLAVLNGTRWAPEDGPEAVVRIYWGSAEGFRHELRRDLVVAGAVDLQAGDLDGDGRADLVVLQTAPGRALIHWQNAGGIDTSDTLDFATPSAGRLALADLTGEGRPALIISGGVRELLGTDPTTGKSEYRYTGLVILAPDRTPRRFLPPLIMAAPQSSALAAADLNGDGRPEILLADRSAPSASVHLLWNNGSGSFDASKATTLPIAWASALAAGDLDGDGHTDLAVGTARGEETYQGKSQVFFGDGRGALVAGFTSETAGVGGVAITREATRSRAIFCNTIAGRLNEDVPVTLYWGNGRGFDPARTSHYSLRSGYASVAADLNDDGYVDLLLLSIVHGSGERHPGVGFNLLWGGPDGLKDERRTVVSEYGLWGVSVADVDRDGWLDLIGNCNQPSPEGEPMRVVIWRGGPDGFPRSRRTVLRADGAEGQNVVADFNRDGVLDIAVAQERAHRVTLFWGDRAGFSEARSTFLPLVAANDLKTADLNRDGWLDLIVTAHRMPDTSFFDFGTYVFWGGPSGFKQANSRQLPGQDGIGICIADFDTDGWLDVFLPGYHYGHTREAVAAHLFWGDPGGFDDQRRTELMQDAGHGAIAADFNGDGRLDLAIACHSRNGTHDTESLVYFGDGARFRRSLPLRLPTSGPHFMQRDDVGNLYDRTYRQTYTSAPFAWQESCTLAAVQVKATIPEKSKFGLAWRAAESTEALASHPWTRLEGDSVPLRPTDRCLQYRADFRSENGDRYPELDRIDFTFH
ncbi:MAG: VCBS repeat-containing protein [Opitutaceae bacterium]|nr:VCBS repeat-containing protein [Opitutaceae bacterium]